MWTPMVVGDEFINNVHEGMLVGSVLTILKDHILSWFMGDSKNDLHNPLHTQSGSAKQEQLINTLQSHALFYCYMLWYNSPDYIKNRLVHFQGKVSFATRVTNQLSDTPHYRTAA